MLHFFYLILLFALVLFFFFFNDTATTEIYTLSLHDALDLGEEFCALELEGFQLAAHRLVEHLGDAAPALGQRRRRLGVALGGRSRFLLEDGEPLGAGIEQREVSRVARRHRRQLVDRHVVLAAG